MFFDNSAPKIWFKDQAQIFPFMDKIKEATTLLSTVSLVSHFT